VIHMLSQEILNVCMHMLGRKVALEQDLSIGTIFRRKHYQEVPLNLRTARTRPDGLKLDFLVLYRSSRLGSVETCRIDLNYQRSEHNELISKQKWVVAP
jgi:hypothetical protein